MHQRKAIHAPGTPRRATVYACSNAGRLAELKRSAASAARYMPALPRMLYLTSPLESDLDSYAGLTELFAQIELIESARHPHRSRFEALARCDAEEALFIDCDTLFLDDISELFEVLSHFDIGLALAPQLFHDEAQHKGIYAALPAVSDAIPEWNSGLLVTRLTPAFRAFAARWSALLRLCEAQGYRRDQPALRSAVAESELRVAAISSNYNFRAHMRQSLRGMVKILHAHGDLEQLALIVNAATGLRHYSPPRAPIDYGYEPTQRRLPHAD